jgi:uncharacterized repeat protein (TIGR01451 family)
LIVIDVTKLVSDTLRNNLQIDMGIIPVGSIGDYVFLDKDGSNTQTAGDTPISGVKVYLLDATGTKIDSTTTGTDGKYLFSNLVSGSYSVQFVAPVGQTFVTATQGGDPTKDSDAGLGGKTGIYTIDTTKPIGDPARDITSVDAGVKPAVNCEKPVLTVGNVVCTGTTYSVTYYSSSGSVSTSAGTMSGSTISGIPVGINVTIKATSGTNCTDSLTIISPVACTTTCIIPKLTVGQPICNQTTYSVSFTVSGGTVSTTQGAISGNSIVGIPVGTNITVTATGPNGISCVTKINVNSPTNCNNTCENPAITISGPICGIDGKYSVNFVTVAGATVTSNSGTVGIGSITGITSGVPVTITAKLINCTDKVVTVPAPTCFIPIFDLAIRKDLIGTGPFKPGDNVTFNITVFNQGNVSAYGVEVTDYIPAGLTLNDATWAMSGANATKILAGPIAPNSSVQVPITLKINTGFIGTNLTNVVEITKADDDTNPNNTPPTDIDSTPGNKIPDEDDIDQEPIPFQPTPPTTPVFDLALTKKVVGSGPFKVGDLVTFEISVLNQGSVQAYGVQVSDRIPTGFTLSDAAWTQSGTNAIQTIAGPIAVGGSVVRTITFKIDPTFTGTKIANVAEITKADDDTNPTNTPPKDIDSTPDNKVPTEDDQDTDVIELTPVVAPPVTPVFDLALVKKHTGSTPYSVGDSVTFTLAVINQGTVAAYNVEVTDYIPTGMTLVDASWTAASGSASKTIVGPIAPGATVLTTIKLRIDPAFTGTSIKNVAEISKADNDSNPANTPPVDKDGALDNNPANNGPVKDDVTNEDNKTNPAVDDLDSSDPDVIDVTPKQYGSIGDYVFLDKDGSNTQTAGDTPISGVKVYLLNAAGTKIDSTTTDSNGKYLFDSLVSGSYSVQFVAPVGQIFVTPTQGGDPTKDSDAAANGKTGTYTIDTTKPIGDPARNITTADAGLKPIPVTCEKPVLTAISPVCNGSTYSVSFYSSVTTVTASVGTVSGNNVTGIPVGTSVTLTATAAQPAGCATTLTVVSPVTCTPTDDCLLPTLSVGQPLCNGTTYSVSFTVKGGTVTTSGGTVSGNSIISIPVGTNIVITATSTTGANCIAKINVTSPTNCNNPCENPAITISGPICTGDVDGTYTINYLLSAGATLTTSAGTASNGTITNLFGGLPVTLAVKLAGCLDKVIIIQSLNCPVIFPIKGSIGDYVFLDKDGSNTQTAGDAPIAGVKVYLLNATGTKIDSTTTSIVGQYLFSNLPLGTYSVQFVAPAGSTFVTATQGGDPTKDSDAGVGGKSSPVTLTTTNPDVLTVDAGIKYVPVIECTLQSAIGSSVFVCKGKPYPTLKAFVAGTEVVSWYKKPVGGTVLSTGLNYTPTGNVVVNDTFYIGAITCPSRVPIVVVVQNCIDTIDLQLTKKVDMKIVKLGDVITYTIKVWNESKTNATGVEVTDQLPAGLQYISSAASRGNYTSASGVWTIGNIAANGDTVSLTIKAKVIGEGVTFNTAEISKADQKDKDSTPGNSKDGEDDLDRACVSVPLKLCLGQGVEVTVPSNYTGIIWKDGQGNVIPSSGNVVTFTKAGTYTFTATNGTCPAGGCCPVIVEEINCCPTEICIPFTITKKKR